MQNPALRDNNNGCRLGQGGPRPTARLQEMGEERMTPKRAWAFARASSPKIIRAAFALIWV